MENQPRTQPTPRPANQPQELGEPQILVLVAQALENVPETMAKHRFMSYHEDGPERTLEILSEPGSVPGMAYTVLADSTIRATMNGQEQEDMPLNRSREECESIVRTALATMVAEETLRLIGPRLTKLEDLTGPQVSRAIQNAGTPALRQTQERTHMPQWMNTTSSRQDMKNPQAICEKFLTRQENWLLLERFTKSYNGYTVSQYNTLARNGAVFRAMEEQESPPLHYYVNAIAPAQEENRTFQHPGEVITCVRQHLQLTKAQWKVFARVPYPSWSGRTPDPTTVAKACEILARANVPRASDDTLATLVPVLSRGDTRIDVQWSHGVPADAWAALARAFVAAYGGHTHYLYPDRTSTALSSLADALRDTIREDMPWGPGNWETLQHRTERWHSQATERRAKLDEKHTRERRESKWTSALAEFTQGPFTVTPVSTVPELDNLAQEMDNCLSSYWKGCTNGLNRIFTVHQEEELAAAVELYLEDNRWLPGQSEGPKRTAAPAGIKTLLKEIAGKYQEADTCGAKAEENSA